MVWMYSYGPAAMVPIFCPAEKNHGYHLYCRLHDYLPAIYDTVIVIVIVTTKRIQHILLLYV